jgi:TonB family protein
VKRVGPILAMSALAGLAIATPGVGRAQSASPAPAKPAPAAAASAPAAAPAAGAAAASEAAPGAETPPAVSPADEVRVMLAAMAQVEADAARMRASFGEPAAGAEAPADPLDLLRLRIEARIRTLLDTAEVAAAAQAARQKLDAGDVAGARARILETMQPFLARSDEVRTLSSYLPRRAAIGRADARLRALLRGNGIDSAASSRLEQLQGLLAAREARDDFAMAAGLEMADLESLHQQAYEAAFQAALTKARARPASELAYQPRTARCPLAADTGPPGDAPRLDTTLSTPTDDYYPKDAFDQRVEGKVALSARVEPDGCVRAAAVLVGTGVEALDAAALRWMLEGAVYRRSVPRADGQPATTSLSVNFKSVD